MHFLYSLLSELTNNIYRIAGLFFVLTIIFHSIFILYRPMSLKNWKLVEYVWVLLALVSTLGIVDESRRLNAVTTLTDAQLKVEDERIKVSNWFASYQLLTCHEEMHQQRCNTFTKIINDIELLSLENELIPDINKNLINSLPQLSPWLSKQSINIIMTRIDDYVIQREKVLALEQQIQRSIFQLLINAITPLLLAFALALKMTKVTAEYLAYRKKDKE